MNVGKAIRASMDREGVSGVELAKRMEVTGQQLSRWRMAEDARLSTLAAVAEGLEIDVIDLVTEALDS